MGRRIPTVKFRVEQRYGRWVIVRERRGQSGKIVASYATREDAYGYLPQIKRTYASG